jgi:hypothetical protein
MTLRFLALLAACCGLALNMAQAQRAKPSHAEREASSAEREAKAREYLTDTLLTTASSLQQ